MMDDCAKLQDDLHALQQWEQMHFNPTKAIQQTTPLCYNIHNITLQEVNTIKHLEIYIDSKLTWKSHVADQLFDSI